MMSQHEHHLPGSIINLSIGAGFPGGPDPFFCPDAGQPPGFYGRQPGLTWHWRKRHLSFA